MNRFLMWVLINGLFIAGIYFGFYKEIEGVENVVLMFAWIHIFMSFFALSKPVVKALSEKGRSAPYPMGIGVDLVIMTGFAWFGAWITAAFWFISMLLEQAAFEEAKKLNSEQLAEES